MSAPALQGPDTSPLLLLQHACSSPYDELTFSSAVMIVPHGVTPPAQLLAVPGTTLGGRSLPSSSCATPMSMPPWTRNCVALVPSKRTLFAVVSIDQPSVSSYSTR